jgi:hypothetical protein
MEFTELDSSICSELVRRLMVKHKVLHGVNMDQHFKDIAMLRSSRVSEVQLGVLVGVILPVCQCEIHHLRDAVWVLTEGLACKELEVYPTTRCLIHMMDYGHISHYFLSNAVEPGMVRNAFEIELNVVGEE